MSAAPGLVARGYRLAIGEDTVPHISVVRSPHVSLAPLMIGASAGVPGTDGRYLLHAVRKALPYASGFALAPMVSAHRAGDELVDAFMPILPYTDVSVADQIESMHHAPDEFLLDDLRRIYGDALPRAWQPAADRPRTWFDSLALATAHAFEAVAPSWHAAAPAIDREIQRVGTALVRGGHDVLLNSLHPRLHYARGMLSFDIPLRRMVSLGGRRLVLVPLIGDSHALLAGFEVPGVAYIGYHVPGHTIAGYRGSGDELALLLGPLRARALRLLARPMSAGALASALDCAANTATYHCNHLEAARLVIRERRGQSVWISRTPRGHELVDLMAS